MVSRKIIFGDVDYDLINSYKIDKHKVEEFRILKIDYGLMMVKATNYDATINALVPYKDKNIHIIIGGDDKVANLKPLLKI